MTPNYIATTADPQIAANIQKAYPGSYIVPQNGYLHIYTGGSQKPAQKQPAKKPHKQPKKQNTGIPFSDVIIYGGMIVAILIILLSK